MDRVEARSRGRPPTGSSGSGSPATPAASPRTISSSPAPPASTTPASRSTASSSGVRARASSPRATTRRRSSAFGRRRTSGRSRLLGHLADHGQHRPLDRLAHGAVGGVARGAEGAREHGAVDVLVAEHLGEAAHDLAEDDAGVAACAHQRSARELLRDRLRSLRGRAVERLHDGAHGEREVRARIAVGHRVHVEVVDPLPVRFEHRERGSAASSRARTMSVTPISGRPRCAPRPLPPRDRSAARPRTARASAPSPRPRRG